MPHFKTSFNMKSSKKSQRVAGSEIMCMPLLDVTHYLKSYFIILVFSMHCLSHLLGEYMADAHSHKLLCPRNQKYSMFTNISTYIHTITKKFYRHLCTLGRQNIRLISTLYSINRRTPLGRTAFKGPLKCLGKCSVIQCVDVISTETGRQGGTY